MVVFGMHLFAFEEHVCVPLESRTLVLDFVQPDDHSHEDRHVDPRLFALQVEMDTGSSTGTFVTPPTGTP
jgi:hypothetical protein